MQFVATTWVIPASLFFAAFLTTASKEIIMAFDSEVCVDQVVGEEFLREAPARGWIGENHQKAAAIRRYLAACDKRGRPRFTLHEMLEDFRIVSVRLVFRKRSRRSWWVVLFVGDDWYAEVAVRGKVSHRNPEIMSFFECMSGGMHRRLAQHRPKQPQRPTTASKETGMPLLKRVVRWWASRLMRRTWPLN
jgi:hypothetical protein